MASVSLSFLLHRLLDCYQVSDYYSQMHWLLGRYAMAAAAAACRCRRRPCRPWLDLSIPADDAPSALHSNLPARRRSTEPFCASMRTCDASCSLHCRPRAALPEVSLAVRCRLLAGMLEGVPASLASAAACVKHALRVPLALLNHLAGSIAEAARDGRMASLVACLALQTASAGPIAQVRRAVRR